MQNVSLWVAFFVEKSRLQGALIKYLPPSFSTFPLFIYVFLLCLLRLNQGF